MKITIGGQFGAKFPSIKVVSSGEVMVELEPQHHVLGVVVMLLGRE